MAKLLLVRKAGVEDLRSIYRLGLNKPHLGQKRESEGGKSVRPGNQTSKTAHLGEAERSGVWESCGW